MQSIILISMAIMIGYSVLQEELPLILIPSQCEGAGCMVPIYSVAYKYRVLGLAFSHHHPQGCSCFSLGVFDARSLNTAFHLRPSSGIS